MSQNGKLARAYEMIRVAMSGTYLDRWLAVRDTCGWMYIVHH